MDESRDPQRRRSSFRLQVLTADGKVTPLLTKREDHEPRWICRRLNEARARFTPAVLEAVTSRPHSEPIDVILSRWPDPPRPGSISVMASGTSLKIHLKAPTRVAGCLLGLAGGLVALAGVGLMMRGAGLLERGQTHPGTMFMIVGGLVGLVGLVPAIPVFLASVVEETVECEPGGLLRVKFMQRPDVTHWRVDRIAAIGVGPAESRGIIIRIARKERPLIRIGRPNGLQVTTTDGKTQTVLANWDEADLEWIAALLRQCIGIDVDPSS